MGSAEQAPVPPIRAARGHGEVEAEAGHALQLNTLLEHMRSRSLIMLNKWDPLSTWGVYCYTGTSGDFDSLYEYV